MPSEHPSSLKIVTPAGNGCNATTRPGISFETMINLGAKLSSAGDNSAALRQKERQVEADFVLIQQPVDANFLTGIAESEQTQKSQPTDVL